MGFLNDRQKAAVKAVRAKGWNREFIIESRGAASGTSEYYAAEFGAPVQQTVCGDWTFREEQDNSPSPGGVVGASTLMLTCDIDHFASIIADGARLIVDGVRYAVDKASSYPETGECVVVGKRVE